MLSSPAWRLWSDLDDLRHDLVGESAFVLRVLEYAGYSVEFFSKSEGRAAAELWREFDSPRDRDERDAPQPMKETR